MDTQRKTRQVNKTRLKSKKIKIIIQRSDDSYSSYAENVPGIYGQGNTVDEAKQAALAGIALLKKYNQIENIPPILKGDYEIVFKFDTSS